MRSCSRITALRRLPGAISSGSCATASSSNSYQRRNVAALTLRRRSVTDAAVQHWTYQRRASRQRSTSDCLPVRSSPLLRGAGGLGLLVLTFDASETFDQANLLVAEIEAATGIAGYEDDE